MGNSERLQVDGQPLTDQEQFILNQAAQGKRADLREQFGNKEKDRQVRARFLEELISGSLDKVNIKRQGVLIGNAIVSEPFNLEFATVMHPVSFIGCEFQHSVDFGHAYFMSHLAISGSTFYKSAKFRQMKVAKNLLCRNTIFYGPVDFGRVQVDEDFNAKGAHFENQEHEISFNGIRVGQNVFFNGTRFKGPVDFTLAKFEGNISIEVLTEGGTEKETIFENSVSFAGSIINGQFQAEQARFEGADIANFSGMRVGDNVWLDGTLFNGDVDFTLIQVGHNLSIMPVKKGDLEIKTLFKGNVIFAGAKIGWQFQASAAHFGDVGKLASFNDMKVGESAFFDSAIFYGPTSFSNANIDGQFNAHGTHFKGKGEDNKASFNGMKVGQDAYFKGAEFCGPVDFSGADIGRQFNVKGAHFIGQDEENYAKFNALKVSHDVFFDDAIFQWPVDFSGMHIGRQFSADGAEFRYEDFKAIFHRLEVSQDAYFRGTFFKGDVDFTMMHISGSFYLDPLQEPDGLRQTIINGNVQFGGTCVGGQLKADFACFGKKGEDNLASFNGLTVGQETFFKGATFEGKVHICYSHLLDLIFGENPAITELFLENTQIGRKLEVSKTTISKLQARNLEVKGPATLREMTISAEADLQYSTFQTLNFEEVNWPKLKNGSEQLYLDGFTFQNLNAGGWQKVIEWLALSKFNSQTYSQVEGYLQRTGVKTWADKVFHAGKLREVNLLPEWKKWPTKILWGGVAGYGRKPYLSLRWILLIIAIGTLTFPLGFEANALKSHEYLKQMAESYPWTTKTILSLDRFLPGVDLGVAKHWAPVTVCWWLYIYWHLQKLLGWILIPIALAAIYTRIK